MEWSIFLSFQNFKKNLPFLYFFAIGVCIDVLFLPAVIMTVAGILLLFLITLGQPNLNMEIALAKASFIKFNFVLMEIKAGNK